MKAIAEPFKSVKYYFKANPATQKVVFLCLAAVCLTPFLSAPAALAVGFGAVQLVGNPYEKLTRKATHILLQIAVIGLGFGMNVNSALQAGKEGFKFTVCSICFVLLIGFVFTKTLRIEKIIGYLIAAGTAICGGSAIAAVSPILKAKDNQISIALGAVFILNSIALLVYPAVGNLLHMSQKQFGLWCAIAIQDTSSVVGAASKYGPHALAVATTVKLARALWIIPLSFITLLLFKNKDAKVKIPYFIGLFVVAMALNTYVPGVQKISPHIVELSKACLTLTLFLIGAGLSMKMLKNVGFKPLLMATMLWILISLGSLWVILSHV